MYVCVYWFIHTMSQSYAIVAIWHVFLRLSRSRCKHKSGLFCHYLLELLAGSFSQSRWFIVTIVLCTPYSTTLLTMWRVVSSHQCMLNILLFFFCVFLNVGFSFLFFSIFFFSFLKSCLCCYYSCYCCIVLLFIKLLLEYY